MKTLHIVEPTLADQTGHCYSYVRSLIKANAELRWKLHVWLDRRGKSLFQHEICDIHPYFYRQWRKFQQWFCLNTLLKSQQPLFIPTAGRADLIYLDRLLSQRSDHAPIFLHFHQWTVTAKKIKLLKKIAARHPTWVIMVPTPALLETFKKAGFARTEYLPCPSYEPPPSSHRPARWEKLVYAGAARTDKGFPQVVDFVEYLTQQLVQIPIVLQVSPPVSGHRDPASQQALTKVTQLPNRYITLHQHTLDQTAYQQLFTNAICLLLYDHHLYQAKFSGVALDAFYAGCPVIATQGTWAAQRVEQFQAGIVVTALNPEAVYNALQSIRDRYAYYAENAHRAGLTLQKEHDPLHTLQAIQKYLE
ncbi:MAG: hypothetical protein A3F41_05190 [Coxiella sp. RIFCSPHIGHO2_12_FULL_44_14]|nr:MAG: hypothetical protein A3F41_05190 [Coxiella sp. RIFCSPHIGHO2_12_FULL_44_14]